MKKLKQKQEPFFVKRVRLRKSIIKTNQILETISNYELQTSKYATIGSAFQTQEFELRDRKSALPLNRATIDEFEFYSTKNNRLNIKNMNNIIKICNDQKKKAVVIEMGKAGLEARRILAESELSRRYQWSADDRPKHKKEKSCSRILSLTPTIEPFEGQFAPTCFSVKRSSTAKPSQRSLVKCSTAISPTVKSRAYLYQKMANMEIVTNNEENHVYEKRIKSYTEFLWKCMLSHNIYVNLDLEPATVSNKKYKPCKAFIGFGNNSNMIKSLLKRRFWWVISEEMTDDCALIWTQVKQNKIYERQERAPINRPVYCDGNVIVQNLEELRFTQSSNLKKRSRQSNSMTLRKANQEFNQFYAPNSKIWSQEDFNLFKPVFRHKDFRSNNEGKQGIKEITYQYKTEYIRASYKAIEKVQPSSNFQSQASQHLNFYHTMPLLHNHLQNNFFLGNKKALFYNLRQYYDKIGEKVFEYLPLTFHIKEGFKDPEYKRFTEFYHSRAKEIKRHERNENQRQKMRNIWIVKPGQNSNQGRGITVIDEVYELDRIIKQSTPKFKSSKQQQNRDAKTFIVQLYLDRPLLYNDRKFDIRHYMLITNIYGVTRAYWYEEGYIRTSAYQFNIHNFEPEIHLTNDAIQKHYPEYGRYEAANKISYSDFQCFLNSNSQRRCNFKDEILPKMRQMGKDAARSVYTKMSPQNQMHNFQIFGLDFMIDRNFKPWLIQINTNPCLQCVCPLLDRIIPYMVEQAFKLSLDLVYPPPTHYPNTSKHYAPLINLETFKYELIFDSLSQGEQIQKLFSQQASNFNDIGVIEEDEEFKDDGKEIKLEDFT